MTRYREGYCDLVDYDLSGMRVREPVCEGCNYKGNSEGDKYKRVKFRSDCDTCGTKVNNLYLDPRYPREKIERDFQNNEDLYCAKNLSQYPCYVRWSRHDLR
jgi:hypothetical protein